MIKWLKNYWYYYKFRVILAAILAAIAIFAVSMFFTRESYDYNVLLCFNKEIPSEVERAYSNALAEYGEDLNGDGKVKVQIKNFSYSKSGKTVNEAANMSSALLSELQMGKDYIFITDEYRFDELERHSVFEQQDFFDAYDGKALSLDGLNITAAVKSALQAADINVSNLPSAYMSVRKAPDKDSKVYKNYENAVKLIENTAKDK